jgi:hypothetical protein
MTGDPVRNLDLRPRETLSVLGVPLTGKEAKHPADGMCQGGAHIEAVALTLWQQAAIPRVNRDGAVGVGDPAIELRNVVGFGMIDEVRDDECCIENEARLAAARPEEHERPRR